MFKIDKEDETTIHLTRGDEMLINLTIDNYIFSKDDKIEFRVYEVKKLNDLPLIDVTTTVMEDGVESVEIYVPPEMTKIGDFIGKPVSYWYEIELNDKNTVIGYDENGAKILKLYPEGKEKTDNADI